MKRLIFTALSLFSASYVPASTAVDKDPSPFSECQSLTDDSKRLQCYDTAAKGNTKEDDKESDSASKEVDSGSWKVNVTQSKIDDSQNVIVALSANDPIRTRFNSYYNPTLAIYCREGKTDMYVDWGSFLTTGEISMIQRIDSEKATNRIMLTSTDNKAAFYQGNVVSLIKKFMGSNKLYLNVTPYGENPIEATFNLAGLTEAIKPLRKACKW